MKYLTTLSILSFLFGFQTILSQNAVPAAGGNASGSGGSVNYTVGQTVYTAVQGSTGSVIQGCQQPYEAVVLTSLPEAEGIQLECRVYPNPSSGFVMLLVNRDNLDNLSFQLYTTNGSLIQNRKITNRETVIEMGGLPHASYFLHILNDQREIKTFILIKN
jgi:hypothetical protein